MTGIRQQNLSVASEQELQMILKGAHYSINDVAKMFDVDRQTVVFWINKEPNIVFYKVGGRYRIPRETVAQLVRIKKLE